MDLKGILPALVTPFDAKGETDFRTLERLIEHHLAKGVHGFVPMGSTGEYYAMSDQERWDVFAASKKWSASAGCSLPAPTPAPPAT